MIYVYTRVCVSMWFKVLKFYLLRFKILNKTIPSYGITLYKFLPCSSINEQLDSICLIIKYLNEMLKLRNPFYLVKIIAIFFCDIFLFIFPAVNFCSLKIFALSKMGRYFLSNPSYF